MAADDEIILLVEEGDPAPGTESTFRCSFEFRRSLTDSDVDYFLGVANQGQFGISGIWGASGAGVFKVALNGDDIVGSTSLQTVFWPRANNLGSVVFLGRTADGFGIYLSRNGVIEKIVEEGDPSPAGGTFGGVCGASFTIPAIHPNEDTVYFIGRTCDGPPQGLYRWSGGAITPVLLAGDAAPGTKGVFKIPFGFDSPVVNAGGDILFLGTFGGSVSSGGGQTGLWVIEDGVTRNVVLGGDSLPDVANGVNVISSYALSDEGTVAFESGRIGEPQDGLFLWTDGGLSAVVLGGQLAPETSGTFTSFSVSRPFLEDRIAFLAATTDPVASTGVFVAECVNGSCGGEPTEIVYFALGDSIASGHGLMDSGRCRRSPFGYPYLVEDHLDSRYGSENVEFKLLACSGATTTDLKKQVNEVIANLGSQPTLVSITIGANDFNWGEPSNMLKRLIWNTNDSYQQWADKTANRARQSIAIQVERLLAYPNVTVIVTGIHDPFNDESVLYAMINAVLPGACFIKDCAGRTEYGMNAINDALGRIPGDVGQPNRVLLAPVRSLFFGHESPNTGSLVAWNTCGSAPPNVADTYIQYPGDLLSNSNPEIRFRWFHVEIDGGDCFHPNHAGAQWYADSVFATAVGILP